MTSDTAMKNDEEFYELYKNIYEKMASALFSELDIFADGLDNHVIMKAFSIVTSCLIGDICCRLGGDEKFFKLNLLTVARNLEEQSKNENVIDTYLKSLEQRALIP